MKPKELYQEIAQSHPYLTNWKEVKDFTDKQWMDAIIKIPDLQKVYSALQMEKRLKKPVFRRY